MNWDLKIAALKGLLDSSETWQHRRDDGGSFEVTASLYAPSGPEHPLLSAELNNRSRERYILITSIKITPWYHISSSHASMNRPVGNLGVRPLCAVINDTGGHPKQSPL